MDNIWGFLLQTASASLVAALLLVMKRLLADKLSPRWQYGVWSILALRVLAPASVTRYVLLPFSLWLETGKFTVERSLSSAYTGAYTPISAGWGLPVLRRAPESVTDWLFVLYLAGGVLCLGWYVVSYARLRALLGRGSPASEQVQGKIAGVCEKYGLKPCRTVAVPGLQSAFVCGVVSPVLAVPAEGELDDKVLLHELLHLKYGDALQNIFWCVLRALHWCNPFLHYVFDRVGNDMESLCDQRVLERLEGEERREYGQILLGMANERYARAPGTTSLSNGGKNIARRIGAIVRFKKYPKGMALVSVCIGIVLACPAVLGTANAYGRDLYFPMRESEWNQAMAMTRIQRCGTVAGALDTYAKGLVHENGIYIAMASPLSRQEELAAEMWHNMEAGWTPYRLASGPELEYLGYSSLETAYSINNLEEQADGSYTAVLGFGIDAFDTEDGETLRYDDGMPCRGTVVIPVTVRKEDGWVVTELDREVYYCRDYNRAVQWTGSPWSWLREYTAVGETGTVTMWATTEYSIDNWSDSGGYYNDTPLPDAEFNNVQMKVYTVYTCGEERPRSSVGIQVQEVYEMGGEPDFSDFSEISMTGDVTGSSTDGYGWTNQTVRPDWDGTVEYGGGSGYGGTRIGLSDLPDLPLGSYVRVFWDGECVEEFTLREAAE